MSMVVGPRQSTLISVHPVIQQEQDDLTLFPFIHQNEQDQQPRTVEKLMDGINSNFQLFRVQNKEILDMAVDILSIYGDSFKAESVKDISQGFTQAHNPSHLSTRMQALLTHLQRILVPVWV